MQIALDNLFTAAELKMASSEDANLTLVRHFVQNGWPKHPSPDMDVYFRLTDELSVFNDAYVTCCNPYQTAGETVGNSPQGRPRIVRTKQRCRLSMWWPAIIDTSRNSSEIVNHAVFKNSTKPTQPPIQHILWPEKS